MFSFANLVTYLKCFILVATAITIAINSNSTNIKAVTPTTIAVLIPEGDASWETKR